MTVKIIGLGKLQKKLRRLPNEARRELRRALEASADDIVVLAKSLVPYKSGDLYDSIDWTWGKSPPGSMTLASVTTGDLTITIYAGGDKAYYARWVEFGTQKGVTGTFVVDGTGRKRRVRRTHSGTAAQPFFYVSFRALRRRVRGRISRATNKAAKRVAAG